MSCPETRIEDALIRVLYVEDMEAHREMVRRVVEHISWLCVDTAATLEEGLHKAPGYDAILLDLFMQDPLAGPFDGLRKMILRVPGTPIVVFTADNSKGEEALRRGATEFLPKTLDAASLVSNAIRSAITKHRHAITLGRHIDSLDEAIKGKSPPDQMAALTEAMKRDLLS